MTWINWERLICLFRGHQWVLFFSFSQRGFREKCARCGTLRD